jgi:methylamine methyltransferase corrinoid protein reductive activase
MRYKIALDLGTSGERAQALDERGNVISTAITLRHPLPGANIMDQLHFTIENGFDVSPALINQTVNKLLSSLQIDLNKVDTIAACGNPIQISLFEGIEIRDLAYAGDNMLKKLKINVPNRNAKVIEAEELNLNVNSKAEVIIPPTVRHEIGADALAMLMRSGILDEEGISLVTDYGTNAEMSLVFEGEVYTGSAASGPAIEGQHIKCGMLASPGAICDVDTDWRNYVLNGKLEKKAGQIVNPKTGEIIDDSDIISKGITGTGVIAAIAVGIEKGLINPPQILTPDKKLRLQGGAYFKEKDLIEALTATAAIAAGHRTLFEEAGVNINELKSVYMAGATGTYVDPLKAQKVNLIPPVMDKVVQVGNTSLSMAIELVKDINVLDEMQQFADSLRSKHIMFAKSETFKFSFVSELGLWTEGMPRDAYNKYLIQYGLQPVPEIKKPKKIVRKAKSDIPDLGNKGLTTVANIGVKLIGIFEGCTSCLKCVKECPENALTEVEDKERKRLVILSELCNGTACKRCEKVCPNKVFKFNDLTLEALC